MNYHIAIKNIIYALSSCLIFTFCSSGYTKEIKDMVGRNVIISNNIKKVYAASPPETMLIYALAPDLLVGLNLPLNKQYTKYFNKYVLGLPVVGGYFGQGRTPNFEKLVEINPDIVIGRKSNSMNDKLEHFLHKFNIPLAYIVIDKLEQYPQAFEVAGNILDRQKRAALLADYTRQTLDAVHKKAAAIPDNKKIRVYYAEGRDGLRTENKNSIHAELINLAGGFNVQQQGLGGRYGNEKITLEKVIRYQPEVIFVDQAAFFKKIFSSPGWKSIPAVKNKQVYLTPKIPFNWFDRPPSFMRILGLKWVSSILYPDVFKWDIPKEIKDFFNLFLQKDISEREAARLAGIVK